MILGDRVQRKNESINMPTEFIQNTKNLKELKRAFFCAGGRSKDVGIVELQTCVMFQ